MSSVPWISGWKYRRPITIDNTKNTNNLTNYQVLITVDTASIISAGKMRSDGGDIRFTDSDGGTLLNYWIESGINTSYTKIWVKIPSIPASSTKTIYLYYGNPSATSQSNGDNTFDFFDDFLGTSLDTTKWTVVISTGGSITISNSILTIAVVSDGTNWKAYGIKSNISLPVLHEVIAKVKWTYASEHESYILDKYTDESNWQGMGYTGYYDAYHLRAVISGTTYDTGYTLSNDNPANYEWWKIRFDGSYETVFRSTDGVSWTQLVSRNTNIFTSGFNAGIRDAVKGTSTSYFYIDYIFAKKYTYPEPIPSIKSEEINLSTFWRQEGIDFTESKFKPS